MPATQRYAGAAPGASRVAARLQALRDTTLLDRLLRTRSIGCGRFVGVLTEPGRVGAPPMPDGDRRPRAAWICRAGGLDIMPTVLHAIGVPVSSELPGRPLTALRGRLHGRTGQHVASTAPAAGPAERKGSR